MTAKIRMTVSTMVVAALVLFGALLYGSTAFAQCPTLTIINNTGIPFNLCLQDGGGAVQCFGAPPGVTAGLPPFVPVGAISAGGNFFPFGGAPGCFGCTQAIWIQANVCGYVCYDPACCTVWVFPPDPTVTCVF